MNPGDIKKFLLDLYGSSIPHVFTQLHIDPDNRDDTIRTVVSRVYDLRLGATVQILIADGVTKDDAIEYLQSAIQHIEGGGLPDTTPLYLPDGRVIGADYSGEVATQRGEGEGVDLNWLINDELWDKAEWKGLAYIDWPEDNMPPCIGLVFGEDEAGREIFKNWVNRFGWVDSEEQIRVGIIEGDVPEKGQGYSVRISVNPFWAEIYVKGFKRQRDPALKIGIGRVHRALTDNEEHLLNFKAEFKKYGRYFILPVTRSSASRTYVPHYNLAIQKREIYFRRFLSLSEEDFDFKAALSKGLSAPENDAPKFSLDLWEPSPDIGRLLARIRSESGARHNASIKDIQSDYFDILDQFVGNLFKKMLEWGSNPHQVGLLFISNEKDTRRYLPVVEKYIELADEFWEGRASTLEAEVRSINCLKSIFGGDIFPSYVRNIASSVGLYVDTLVLPDPLFQFKKLRDFTKPDRLLYYVVKHALNALRYRELALADVDPPIVLIAPNFMELDQSVAEKINRTGQVDALYHCSKLFGRDFAGESELLEFLEQFENPEQIISSLADPARLLFDTDSRLPLDRQLIEYIRSLIGEAGVDKTQMFIPHIGSVIYRSLIGRMMQANEILYKASRFNGTPMVDAPTSWQYFVWKNEYDRERAADLGMNAVDVAVTRSLHARGSKDIRMLTDLPEKVLVDLRRRGALADFRQTLRRGIDEIDAATPESLKDVTETVTQNISDALTRHELELIQLSNSKRRFFGYDVSALIAVASMAITAAATGNVPLSIISAALGVTGAPTAKDLWNEGKKLVAKGEELKRSPTSILFNYIDVNRQSITDRYRPGKGRR